MPVAGDMSDLAQNVDWLRAHDDVARRIGENGQALAMSLDYETKELKAASRVIAAATRYSANKPEANCQIRARDTGRACDWSRV